MNEALSIMLLTLELRYLSTLLSSIIAIPLGILLGIYENKTGKLLRPVFIAFTGLPPVIAGIVVHLISSNHGTLDSLKWLCTGEVIIIAQMLIVIPIICSQTFPVIMPIRDTYSLNSLGLDLSPSKIFKQVPGEIKMPIIAAMTSGFGRALAEVGAVMIMGGNIRFKTRVMTSAIALENSKGNYQTTLQLGFILVIISLIASFSVMKFLKVAENDRT